MSDPTEVTAIDNERILQEMRLAGQNFEAIGKTLEETLDMKVPSNRAEKRRFARANGLAKKGNGGLAVDFGERTELVAVKRAIKRTSGARRKVR